MTREKQRTCFDNTLNKSSPAPWKKHYSSFKIAKKLKQMSEMFSFYRCKKYF